MKCLTQTECSEWLQERGIVESPYSRVEPVNAHYFQFEPPLKPSRLTAFTRALIGASGEFPGALVVFTDWSTYSSDEMALVDSLRRSHGEHRWLIHAPGHLFGPTEEAEAIGHCYLAVIFGWSAYLYLTSSSATVYFWEGDLIDFWSPDASLTKAVLGVVQEFELRVSAAQVSEQIAPPEPPPDVSISGSPDHRTLDSLPAPDSGGGR